MSTTGLPVFDTTVQNTNLWLKALIERLHTGDRHHAYLALHALRDRLGPENAVHFSAQLPMLVRGLYFEGWHLEGTPTKERTRADFFRPLTARAAQGLGGSIPISPPALSSGSCGRSWRSARSAR
jgi:uncharacterized protein (DUF2267 family)